MTTSKRLLALSLTSLLAVVLGSWTNPAAAIVRAGYVYILDTPNNCQSVPACISRTQIVPWGGSDARGKPYVIGVVPNNSLNQGTGCDSADSVFLANQRSYNGAANVGIKVAAGVSGDFGVCENPVWRLSFVAQNGD